jgi:Ferritin-like domain
MAGNRITFFPLMAVTLAIAGCGGGGATPTTRQGEKEADLALVDTAIAREMATVDAYDHGLAMPGKADTAVLRQIRAQDQEHVDALMKAIRGFGGKVDPEKVIGERDALDYRGIKGHADFLAFAYEREGLGVAGDLDEVSRLSAAWPRTLLASIATDQAQHLVLLRRTLGAGPLASVPAPFEVGTTPAP